MEPLPTLLISIKSNQMKENTGSRACWQLGTGRLGKNRDAGVEEGGVFDFGSFSFCRHARGMVKWS